MISWRTKQTTHDGLPLFIRYHERFEPDARRLYTKLVVITHHFSHVQANGLPEADYNDGLLSFDCDIRAAAESDRLGVTVLIETFAGKRHYYIYVAAKNEIERVLSDFARRYRSERITWSVRQDPDWGFFDRYLAELRLE